MCFLAKVTPDRRIVNPRAVSRGNRVAVLAAATGAAQGEIVLHNHPSGILDPSQADLALAARVYEAGLGTGIVDNLASSLYVVVEPPTPRTRVALDPDALESVLAPGGALQALFEGYENRPAQLEMLRGVATRFNEGGVAIIEAGTGTGKSLAYLLPAVEWAMANGERSVVSTNTINLQEQLVGKDLPLVRRLMGRDFRWSLVKGRGNYVSIRRLLLASQTAPTLFEEDRVAEMDGLVDWSRKTSDGSLSDLVTPPAEDVWEEIRSDSDICMGARCPHFQACFYQQARRDAHSADVLVVNHALLFADVSLRRATDNWSGAAVLPPFRHLVIDEAHNVEDAATLHLGAEVTRRGLFRTLNRLDRNRKGVLRAVEEVLERSLGGGKGGEAKALLERMADRLRPSLDESRDVLGQFLDAIEPMVPREDEEPLRLGQGDPRDPGQHPATLELLETLQASLERLRSQLSRLRSQIEEDPEFADALEGRLLDLESVERRLEAGGRGLALVLTPGRDQSAWVRWIEGRGAPSGSPRNVLFAAAPVEPGPILRESLFDRLETTIATSATLSTAGGFRFIRGRLGLMDGGGVGSEPEDDPAHRLALADVDPSPISDFMIERRLQADPLEVAEILLTSPFDYQTQALFGVPTDLPAHHSGLPFQATMARVVADFARITDGGLFVLFTSYRSLRAVAALVREAGTDRRWPVFVHGEAPRTRLLQRFVQAGNGILLGTASFWEGVDVPGRPLRGLVLQKIPFRVPSEPITQARMEAIEGRGMRAFESFQVPHAALRLKQGFGRLIRSRDDRGGVLLLDSRILTRRYGRALRVALPPAPLVKGPWNEVRVRLEDFYADGP